MAKPPLTGIDPLKIFMHADGFYKANRILGNIDFSKDTQTAIDIAAPVVVLQAFNCELFLKCLICIETNTVPRGHDLSNLFDQIQPKTKARIIDKWNNEIVPMRKERWEQIEASRGGSDKFPRNLPAAIQAGQKAFEIIRYGYEGNAKGLIWCLGDLPPYLGQIILEMKPEWANARRPFHEIPKPSAPTR